MLINDFRDIHGEPICVEDYVTIKRYGVPVNDGFIQTFNNNSGLVSLRAIDGSYFTYPMSEEDTIEIIKKYEKEETKPDMVNHPPHYQSNNGIEVIDVIEAFTEDLRGGEATNTGNVIKYMLRWKKKKNPLEDLKKARWYLDRLINLVETKMKKENA